MKILFLNGNVPNYVTDGLFHGLKSIPGVLVVDTPRLDYMYEDAASGDLAKTGSRGNTLYSLLPDAKEANGKRTFWQTDLEEYDYIVFTNIFQQCDLFHFIYKSINPKKRNALCIIDGDDMPAMFPFFNNSFNIRVRPWSYFYRIRKANYFKREYESTGSLVGVTKEKFSFLNKLFSAVLKKPSALLPISMSIPGKHIEYVPLKNKIKEFVDYNVDEELSDLFNQRKAAELGKWQPAFEKQKDYYDDIRQSKFGITTKRAGWDCLRHYEYAAKGAILCFKNLQAKNEFCAPFGLNESNCITYHSREDLLNKIKSKSVGELESIQENQYRWIENHTTEEVANRFLDQLAVRYSQKNDNKIFAEFKAEF